MEGDTAAWLAEANKLFKMCEGNAANSGAILWDNYEAYALMGWCKHAFVLSFFFLELATLVSDDEMQNFFFKAVRETIRLGGDTDTNGAIVGGLIGALVGVKAIPTDMLQKVLSFDCSYPVAGIGRDGILSAKWHAINNIESLM